MEINKSHYNSELKGDMLSFLQVRLGGLMDLDAGELFNTEISTLHPEEWLYSSAIVELEVLDEQTKNFFILLVCHYILETLRVNPLEGRDEKTGRLKPVRHAIFIEEAHNIIASSSEQSSSDSVDPKISATAYIVKMLAEVRALREAIIIADQLPTALATEVTKNTGLKLVHRLTSQDDREQIGSAISATPLQLEQVASFSKGKALIYHEKTMKPFRVQVAEWKKPKINYNFSNDKELYQHIINRKNIEDEVVAALDSLSLQIDDELVGFIQLFNEKFKNLNVHNENEVKQYVREWKYIENLFTNNKKLNRARSLYCDGVTFEKKNIINSVIKEIENTIKDCKEKYDLSRYDL